MTTCVALTSPLTPPQDDGSLALCKRIWEAEESPGLPALRHLDKVLAEEFYNRPTCQLPLGQEILLDICRGPVSYTHLDVYKRQVKNRTDISTHSNG